MTVFPVGTASQLADFLTRSFPLFAAGKELKAGDTARRHPKDRAPEWPALRVGTRVWRRGRQFCGIHRLASHDSHASGAGGSSSGMSSASTDGSKCHWSPTFNPWM